MIESVDEFIRLRTSELQEEYQRAAREPAPLAVWHALVDDHPDMRFWVAQNKTVPLDVLARLARDEDARVRAMVAMKRKLPQDLQRLLAVDPDASVRNSLVRNAKVDPDVLATLAAGTDWVAARAKERLSG